MPRKLFGRNFDPSYTLPKDEPPGKKRPGGPTSFSVYEGSFLSEKEIGINI